MHEFGFSITTFITNTILSLLFQVVRSTASKFTKSTYKMTKVQTTALLPIRVYIIYLVQPIVHTGGIT